MKFTGERYGTFLPITEIARLTRAELKTLFPDWKFSVRTKKFSGGRSMDVSLQAGPESPFATLKVAPDPMFPDLLNIHLRPPRSLPPTSAMCSQASPFWRSRSAG